MTAAVIATMLVAAAQAARTPAWKQPWQYRWQVWLPEKWRRVAACETHLRWDWNSGQYVSAFGIERYQYRLDARYAGTSDWPGRYGHLPTPWQQWRTALAHYRLHGGFDGWGCKAA